MSSEQWQAYLQALNAVHAERDQATAAGRLDERTRAARAQALADYGSRLAVQREHLAQLATDLRTGWRPADVAPQPVEELGWQAGVEQLDARLQEADDVAAEARRIGHRPQFLPAWEGTFARSMVVLVGLALPNAVFTIFLSLAGVRGSQLLLFWFVVGFPLILALGGGLLLARISAPRLTDARLDGLPPGGLRPRWRHRLLAFPIAWASWLVPGLLLDQLMPR